MLFQSWIVYSKAIDWPAMKGTAGEIISLNKDKSAIPDAWVLILSTNALSLIVPAPPAIIEPRFLKFPKPEL